EALRADIPFAAIVLATPHGPYRDPTEADLRWQVYTALACGARGILYFTYWTPESDVWNFHDGILDEKGRRTTHYAQVQNINRHLNARGRTLARLHSEGVYLAGELPIGTQGLPAGGTVREVTGGEVVVGLFRDPRRVVVSFNIRPSPEGEYLLLAN